MATNSPLSYCNRALSLLGHEPISVLPSTEGEAESATAALCLALYEAAVEELLSCWQWRFATKRLALSQRDDDPPQPWSYQYDVPTDLLRLIRTDSAAEDFDIFHDATTGRKVLYANRTGLEIEYVFDVDDTLFPAHFQSPLVYKLAALLAMPVTEDIGKAQLYEGLCEKALGRAKTHDYNEAPAREIDDGNRIMWHRQAW